MLRVMRASPALRALSAFSASMPERYRDLFDASAIREHAAIVGRRGDAPVHVELWRRQPRGGAIACVVADDRPGLLSLISAALVVNGMDVVAAQAFTRARGGEAPEAVDLFWLRRDGGLPSPVLAGDVARVARTLHQLVTGDATVEDVIRRARTQRASPAPGATRVTFDDAEAGLSVLTVETFDRPGLLLAITRALHRARVQIVASEAATQDGRIVDRFTVVELDGAPVRPTRRGVLQMEVLAAIEAVMRGA